MKNLEENYDIVVVGAGHAGLTRMAPLEKRMVISWV